MIFEAIRATFIPLISLEVMFTNVTGLSKSKLWGPIVKFRLNSWRKGISYPIISKVLAPSQIGKLAGFLNHQQ